MGSSFYEQAANNKPHEVVELYRILLEGGEPVPWELIHELKAAGYSDLAEEAIRQLARSGNVRAQFQIFLLVLRDLLAWLSPSGSTRRKIRRMRVPGTVFDVGPWGIAGWYMAMQNEIGLVVKRFIEAVAGCGLLSMVTADIPDWFYDNILGKPVFKTVLILIWQSYLVRGLWHLSVAEVYVEEWDALETQGPQWHFENNNWFRYVFKRIDGSYQIDGTLRQQRLQDEIKAVRACDAQLVASGRQFLVALLCGGGLFAVATIIVNYVSLLQGWNIPGIVSCFFLFQALPPRAIAWLRHLIDSYCYEHGKQFIPSLRVFDPVHEPLTLERVKAQAALGDAAFVDPMAASEQLRS